MQESKNHVWSARTRRLWIIPITSPHEPDRPDSIWHSPAYLLCCCGNLLCRHMRRWLHISGIQSPCQVFLRDFSSDGYLLLTCPTLPVYGVALNGITARSDQGISQKWAWTAMKPGILLGYGTLLEVDVKQWPIPPGWWSPDRSQLAKAEYRIVSIKLRDTFIKSQYSGISRQTCS